MRVYLAAPYGARAQVRGFAEELEQAGHTVTSSWLKEAHEMAPGVVGVAPGIPDQQAHDHVEQDLRDLSVSDVLVLITESVAELEEGRATTGGRHIETGAALARVMPVIVVGTPENIFHRSPRVIRVKAWAEVISELGHLTVLTGSYPSDDEWVQVVRCVDRETGVITEKRREVTACNVRVSETVVAEPHWSDRQRVCPAGDYRDCHDRLGHLDG